MRGAGRRAWPPCAAALAEITGGLGADHVFLVAGGKSNGPVELAAKLARDRATVVDIGKMQARPAVERLLREGAGRPVLPVLRSRPLRRPVRARGHRLPGRLRALDRAAQPGVLPRPGGPQATSRSSRWSPDLPVTDAAKVYGDLSAGALKAVGFLFEYPAPDRETRQARRQRWSAPLRPPAGEGGRNGQAPSGSPSASSAPATTPRRCCCRTWRSADVELGPRRDHEVAVGGQRPAKFGFTTASTDAEAVLDDERSTRSSS